MEALTRKEMFLKALAEGTKPPTPMTREEALLAKGISWKSLTDKPFGTTQTRTEVVPEMELNMTKPDGWNAFVHRFDKNILKFDTKYVVVLDGVEYVATTKAPTHGGLELGDNTPELPFRITTEENSYGSYIASYITTDSGTEKTFALYTLSEETKTLDPTYLPKAAAVADVTAAPTAAEFNALLTALRDAGYLAVDNSL